MTPAIDFVGRAGRTLLMAFFVSPALWPIERGITSAAELAGVPLADWILLVPLLAVGIVIAEAYDGPAEVVLPTALLVVILFVGFQWLVGLRGLDVVSMRLLAANAFVYLASVSCAVAVVFETALYHRITGFYGIDADAAGSSAE